MTTEEWAAEYEKGIEDANAKFDEACTRHGANQQAVLMSEFAVKDCRKELERAKKRLERFLGEWGAELPEGHRLRGAAA